MFGIRGIKRASCSGAIESAIENMKGIVSILASPIQGEAVIRYKPELINVNQLITIFLVHRSANNNYLWVFILYVIIFNYN